MSDNQHFVSGPLDIEVINDIGSISVHWRGKSIDRDPGKFITPILTDVINASMSPSKSIILDFRELEYMNSSTITPVIKVLERAKRGNLRVELTYDRSLKWQDLSFSAMEIFRTRDGRVVIKGL